MKRENKPSAFIDEKRLEEIASIIPIVDEEAPEITPEQAVRARLRHDTHPEWLQKDPKGTE